MVHLAEIRYRRNYTTGGPKAETRMRPLRFERFVLERQNFAGLGVGFRYYLLHFEYGRFVPWLDASIAPGYTDLNIGRVSNETKLTGPFMNLIEAGVGGARGRFGRPEEVTYARAFF
jgi:hypothetical protein